MPQLKLLELMNISTFEDFEDFSPEDLDPQELYSLLTDIAYEDSGYFESQDYSGNHNII